MATEFVKRWNRMVSKEPVRPGIYRLQWGGWFLIAKVTDPRDPEGNRVQVSLALPGGSVQEAQTRRDAMVDEKLAELNGTKPKKQLFNFFVASRAELKCRAGGSVKSAKGRQKIEGFIRVHLFPFFDGRTCDEIDGFLLDEWRQKLALMIDQGYESKRTLKNGKVLAKHIKLAPVTANTWIAMFKAFCADLKRVHRLSEDPSDVLLPFDTSQHETYTEEDPNTLTVEQMRDFLRAMREFQPQHFAMTMLGFLTGKRPSTLRPLRASGPEADVIWDDENGAIRFRRSHTLGDEFMVGTKTLRKEKVAVPKLVLDELRAHREMLKNPPMNEKWGKPPLWWREPMAVSDFLFPGRDGGPRSTAALDKPFELISKKIGLPFIATPKCMRRTFNDVCRLVGVHDVVKMSISGHETEEMANELYSTAQAHEHRDAITKIANVVDLANYRRTAS